ncbi:MAG: flagellar motor protein MotB [Methylomonas sp.]|nr:MAG: flagellar motor protein MotB [Methylomonas sp.]PPD25492.1 MAG: flagellar motor protein MotB [Methylomonas sp.]PPD36288.1 MAG: flagellar motor protein MotB [Methylomonas sp.]PPD42413.1 MAG: flagellar motor protein MotB [Methylomonas sp.]PPD53123.1 MAG: flagellar motor protein MotB [Methylomonas sp.]
MKKHHIYLPLAILATSLTACSTARQDPSTLKAAIDASMAGHYGQAVLHLEEATEALEDANDILKHQINGHYWNINETQKGLDAAKSAAAHRLESEKHMCEWLKEVHAHNHHQQQQQETVHKAVAYFATGSAEPFKTEHTTLSHIGEFLHHHSDARATVTASTDTVGNPAANQALSEKRARTVANILIKHGASAPQISTEAVGEASGPDNLANQGHRVAVVIATHPGTITKTIDCSHLNK